MKSLIKNKKAQADAPIITFIVIAFSLFLLAPIVLKIANTTQSTVSSSLGNMTNNGGQTAQTNFNSAITPLINFWDKIVVFAFFVSVILLFISGFFIDTNPAFIIVFIVLCFGVIIYAPDIMNSLNNIYNSQSFATESAQLSFIGYLINHFGEILVGLMIVLGIIIYGKVAIFPSQTGGTRR